MRELNDILGMERMEENLQVFIYQESSGKFSMVASIEQLQKPSAEKIQKFLQNALEGHYDIRGITFTWYRNERRNKGKNCLDVTYDLIEKIYNNLVSPL